MTDNPGIEMAELRDCLVKMIMFAAKVAEEGYFYWVPLNILSGVYVLGCLLYYETGTTLLSDSAHEKIGQYLAHHHNLLDDERLVELHNTGMLIKGSGLGLHYSNLEYSMALRINELKDSEV